MSLAGAGGSQLVIDRLAGTHADIRLVAHLAPDEPPENARIVCAMYLADERRGNCRHVSAQDLEFAPFAQPSPDVTDTPSPDRPLLDADGVAYRIADVSTNGSFPELRWTRVLNAGREHPFEPLTLRDVVAHFEDYEPMRQNTVQALATYGRDARVSTVVLRGELARLNASRIVLNRRLREAVAERVARGELSMSEIAIRCGRVKRDGRRNVSGETSWLGRRIGQLPEGGKATPTPWVHSDVLALIARKGLGVCPGDVEL
ncbi:MAG: hypothetical protein ACYDA6_11365 [Solirubrobacteraceae bacterium]